MAKLIEINNKKPFAVKCKTDTIAEIIIYEDIGQGGFFSEALSAKDFSKELKSLPDTVNTIEVRINSGGGDVFDGVTIYNRLKQHKAKIIVYIDGLAASIASVIAMAGDEIIMSEGSLLMIHKPWTVAMGDSKDFENTISRLDDVEEQLLSIYQRKTKIDRNELRSMLAAETWLDADQAVDMGFATSKATEEALPIAASLKTAKWINKKPRVENATKKKVAEFKKDIESYLARK